MKTTNDLRRIASEIRDRCPGAAGELGAFADFLEDLDAAKQRKLEMQANLPPSRQKMLERTIDFEKGRANAGEAWIETLEGALTLTLQALRQAVDAIQAALNGPRPLIPLVPIGTLGHDPMAQRRERDLQGSGDAAQG